MLPFLKNRQEGGAAAAVETKERKPDEPSEYDMFDAVAEDILLAVEKKDKSLLKDALSAFADHLQDMDQEQDQQLMKG